MTAPEAVEAHKQAAVAFLEMAVAGHVDEAYDKYVDLRGKHHNAYFPAGFAALKQSQLANRSQFPDVRIEIKHVLGDGDLVAVHSHVILKPREMEVAALHLFRFAGDRIVEMWDLGQPVLAELPNEDGMF